jgi:hypothetical protein
MADPARTGQVLDEDDDFVEFSADNWDTKQSSLNSKDLWDTTWFDDDSTEDAVAQQLRTELETKAQAQQQAAQS